MRNGWTDDRLDDLNGKLDELGQRMDRRFEGFDQRFDALQHTMLQGFIGICAVMVPGSAAIVGAIIASS
jgi:hypothetical protein